MNKYILISMLLVGCGTQTEEDMLQDELNDGLREFALSCEKVACAKNQPSPSVAKLLDPWDLHHDYICWTEIYFGQTEEKLGVAINPKLLKNKNPKTVVYEKTFECLIWLGRTTMSFSDFKSNLNMPMLSDSN